MKKVMNTDAYGLVFISINMKQYKQMGFDFDDLIDKWISALLLIEPLGNEIDGLHKPRFF